MSADTPDLGFAESKAQRLATSQLQQAVVTPPAGVWIETNKLSPQSQQEYRHAPRGRVD